MKTIQMDELPKCDICKNAEAHYDDKLKDGRPWGYLCEDCWKEYGTGIGTRLEKRVKIDAPKSDKVPVVMLPLSLDSLVEAKCPHCGEPRSFEPDANYVVECESCGNRFKVVSLI